MKDGFEYHYYLKDHLGSTRVVLSQAGETLQQNSYYPFGMLMEGSNAVPDYNPYQNKYLYNGKELQTDFGLDWYDYGKRFYDEILGRFTGVDPLADTFAFVTPYNYAENSPIANVDLWGLQAVPFQGVMGTFDKTGYSKMVDRQNKAIEQIDYVGVSYSGNAFVGGGGGGDINLAYVKGDGVFVNFTGKTGPGGDVSHGIKFTIGYYSGKGKPTAKSTTGPAIYEDGGALSVTVGSSHDLSVSKETKGPTVGENWNFISFGFSLGSKTVAGGSAGVSYSTPVIYLFKENNTQETNNKNNEKPEKIKENDNDAGNVGIQF
jgi:RHS repeat-associated protein